MGLNLGRGSTPKALSTSLTYSILPDGVLNPGFPSGRMWPVSYFRKPFTPPGSVPTFGSMASNFAQLKPSYFVRIQSRHFTGSPSKKFSGLSTMQPNSSAIRQSSFASPKGFRGLLAATRGPYAP